MTDSTTSETLLLTTEEAVALIKRAERVKGTRFYAHMRFDAPIVDKPDRIFPYGCHAALELSKRDALKAASTMLSKTLEERGARICMTKRTSAYDGAVSYWFS
jgi:hypothetical protein